MNKNTSYKEYFNELNNKILTFNSFYTTFLTYTRDDLFKKLNEVCKKLNISSYELDVKLSESLLKNWTMKEIRDQEIIMKVLNKILDKK